MMTLGPRHNVGNSRSRLRGKGCTNSICGVGCECRDILFDSATSLEISFYAEQILILDFQRGMNIFFYFGVFAWCAT